jgi:hypothetical protein
MAGCIAATRRAQWFASPSTKRRFENGEARPEVPVSPSTQITINHQLA